MRIELELLPSKNNLPVDLGALRLSNLFSLSLGEIEKLSVPVAGHPSDLGQHFKVTQCENEQDELVLRGETGRIASAGRCMETGRLVVEGDAGPFTGAEMSGGELQVLGKAGDCLGAAMRGGLLRVRGDAGDWCGAALPGRAKGMTGGTLLVEGNVGAEAGAGMRRGLLVVCGDSGESIGASLLAGTIFCLGRIGKGAGLEMKRGSLVAGSSAPLLPGFRPAGEADPEWLRIYLAWLGRLGLPGSQASWQASWNGRLPRRFTGDHLMTGKGELLVYDILE